MELLPYALIGVFLGIGAFFDYKTMKVPDAVNVCLWACFLFSEINHFAIIASFCWAFAGNTFHVMLFKKPFWSWGDILAFPAFFLMCASLVSVSVYFAFFLVALGVMAPILWAIFTKEKVPLLPSWFFLYMFGLMILFSR